MASECFLRYQKVPKLVPALLPVPLFLVVDLSLTSAMLPSAEPADSPDSCHRFCNFTSVVHQQIQPLLLIRLLRLLLRFLLHLFNSLAGTSLKVFHFQSLLITFNHFTLAICSWITVTSCSSFFITSFQPSLTSPAFAGFPGSCFFSCWPCQQLRYHERLKPFTNTSL